MAPSASLLLLLLLGLSQALPLLENKDRDGENHGDEGKDADHDVYDDEEKQQDHDGDNNGDEDKDVYDDEEKQQDHDGDNNRDEDKDVYDDEEKQQDHDGDNNGDEDKDVYNDEEKQQDHDGDNNGDEDKDGDHDVYDDEEKQQDHDGDNNGDEDKDGDHDVYDDEEKKDHLAISTRILAANKASDTILVEGDMVAPKSRNAMKCFSSNSCLWKQSADGLVTIPYVIGSEFGAHEKQVIEGAIKVFAKETCIRFTPRKSESDYINFVSKTGCYSELGRKGGMQELSLNKLGCIYGGIAQHEMNHALGFQHEQTRSDRDKYVKINFENITPSTAYNFEKHDTNNLDTPYDYSSIMHYGKDAFSVAPGKDSITPIPNANVQIGQRNGLSSLDIKRIKKLYGCK
ncbi:high choriolytic enzyme 1 [Austrofundulus limnaeus]|uniref:Metalloendopeptidase n=1 Tax=Austrofundulus limnaeus TaxID=52670 RepID=A0A2I4C0C9_AUSLI|nr:PREDICTED: high choriolytic enzyme 1-like [Austrofundulus limnaeus]